MAIPWDSFSNDWSSFTGDCDTKDPTGKQVSTPSAVAAGARPEGFKGVESVGCLCTFSWKVEPH